MAWRIAFVLLIQVYVELLCFKQKMINVKISMYIDCILSKDCVFMSDDTMAGTRSSIFTHPYV